MKNIFKILLVFLVLLMALTSFSTVVFAKEAQSAEMVANGEIKEKTVENSYEDKEGNLVFVFEDGSEYNVTKQIWIVEPTEQKTMTLKFDFSNLSKSLTYMWQGMLCIFVVIGVIILSVFLMNFISYRIQVMKDIKEEQKENN